MTEPRWPVGPRFVVRQRYVLMDMGRSIGGDDVRTETRWAVVDRAYCHETVARARSRGRVGLAKMVALADRLNAEQTGVVAR